MKKIWIAVVLIIAMIVSGCAQNVVTAAVAGNLMTGIIENTVDPGDTTSDTAEFAVNLLKTTYNGENTVLSPLSAYLALAMTSNGATGLTLREFERVLGARTRELNDTGKILLDAINASPDVTLKSVNGIWYNTDSGFVPAGDFLQTNADYFGAAAVAADFSKPETVNAINRFVSENTNGLIDKMLDKLDGSVMVLINTLYFKGDWANQFDPNDTTDALFTLTDGETIYTPTMEQEFDAVSYFESENAKGIILPYVDDRYAYVAILPAGAVSDFVSALSADGFKALLDASTEQTVKLYLPKYELDGSYDLNEVLKSMGLASAFDPDKADFSAMGSAELGNIYIDKVKQNTVFKLGEKGTEAAAATSVQMELSAMEVAQELIELHLDRPFVYALMDMETMTPLFLGVLENPAG